MVPPLLPALARPHGGQTQLILQDNPSVYSRISVLNPPCLILGKCCTRSCVSVILGQQAHIPSYCSPCLYSNKECCIGCVLLAN